MKKLLLFILIASSLFMSCKSSEQKALVLIDRELFKSLYDYSSYEPVETRVDSAFTTIYRDLPIMLNAVIAEEARKQYVRHKEKADNAYKYAEIYAGSYYSHSKFAKYKNEYLSELERAKVYLQAWVDAEGSIVLLATNFAPEFIGWEVYHKFRCKSKGGYSLLKEYIYIMDENFKEIKSSEDREDEDIIAINERIDLAMKSTKDDEIE